LLSTVDIPDRETSRRKQKLTPIQPGKYVLKSRQVSETVQRNENVRLSYSQHEDMLMDCSENLEDNNVPDNNHGIPLIYFAIYYRLFCDFIV